MKYSVVPKEGAGTHGNHRCIRLLTSVSGLFHFVRIRILRIIEWPEFYARGKGGVIRSTRMALGPDEAEEAGSESNGFITVNNKGSLKVKDSISVLFEALSQGQIQNRFRRFA